MRISDWSSDVCSSDLPEAREEAGKEVELLTIGDLQPDDVGTGPVRLLRKAEHRVVATAIAGVEQSEALRIDRVLDEFRKHAHRKQPALCEIPFGRGVERVGDIGFEVRIAERHRPVKRPVVILFITDLAARGQVRLVGTADAARKSQADDYLVSAPGANDKEQKRRV